MIHPSGKDLRGEQIAVVTRVNNADQLQALWGELSPWSCSEASNCDDMKHNFGNYLIDKIAIDLKDNLYSVQFHS